MTEQTKTERTDQWVFSDLATMLRERNPSLNPVDPTKARRRAKEILTVGGANADSKDLRTERRWTRDGIDGELVTWNVGYGPRTEAWILKPTGITEPLPAVLALHGHDGFRFFGKEKIADGWDEAHPRITELRRTYYDGEAFANRLAAQGFIVLVHDVIGWGSRRFREAEIPARIYRDIDLTGLDDIEVHNRIGWHHEGYFERCCNYLGATSAGLVSFEDRVAANYLRSRSDVVGEIGCIGLSGGGARAAYLAATHDTLAAAAIIGMMTTYAVLTPEFAGFHGPLLAPAGWSLEADWPDLAGAGAPKPLLVQYNFDDFLFPALGMLGAHERLQSIYEHAGTPAAYVGKFYPGGHKFDRGMQGDAFRWLSTQLVVRTTDS